MRAGQRGGQRLGSSGEGSTGSCRVGLIWPNFGIVARAVLSYQMAIEACAEAPWVRACDEHRIPSLMRFSAA